jgi:hypothetical protein
MESVISLISTFAILLPIVTGIVNYKKAENVFRLFLCFLLYGFLTDLLSGVIQAPRLITFAIFKSYSLAEALFIFWFLFKVSGSKIIQKMSMILLFHSVMGISQLYFYWKRSSQ